jgi:hypothetical protein
MELYQYFSYKFSICFFIGIYNNRLSIIESLKFEFSFFSFSFSFSFLESSSELFPEGGLLDDNQHPYADTMVPNYTNKSCEKHTAK